MATSFKPNYQITIISGCGLAGIVLALFFLSIEKGPTTGSVFHEVGYYPGDVVNKAIRHLTDSLHRQIWENRAKKRDWQSMVDKHLTGDSATVAQDSINHFARRITEDSSCIVALNQDRLYYEDSTLTDTNAVRIATRWAHFELSPSALAGWDRGYREAGRSWQDSVRYCARFPVNGRQLVYTGIAGFRIIPYKSNIEFMAKYPGVGTWVFIMVIFCGFCFITVPASIYIMEQVLKIFTQEERPSQRGYWLSTLVMAGCLILFLVVLFQTFSDEAPVKDLYFMRTLGNALWFVNVLGCIAGAFCLAGFVHSASMLGYFADKLKVQTDKVRVQRVEGEKKVEDETKHTEYADQFRRLLGFFHRYFILSSILLSLVVLCTGALYNATNSMSFLRLIAVDWGYSPASGDAVYLFGGLFTAILLLVYLPAKMQFGDVRLQLPDDGGRRDEDDDSKWYGVLEQPFSWLRGGLIAASPFLLGVVQGLLGLVMRR